MDSLRLLTSSGTLSSRYKKPATA
uniref:Uncharacterized protein n=1 Tax=Bionectria ochroleuca TaxID=29856 RepID=A0A0B7KR34_BIOOC